MPFIIDCINNELRRNNYRYNTSIIKKILIEKYDNKFNPIHLNSKCYFDLKKNQIPFS